MSIAENIAQVKANMERAARNAGRDPKEILLVGATKMNDAARVKEAIAAGLPCCGENRVQELLEKHEAGAYAGADLHFIGTLQKNKAKYLVGLVSLIHSVDSVELMKEVSKQALKRGIRQDILLEVNTGGEASKSGLAPGELASVLERAGEFPGIFGGFKKAAQSASRPKRERTVNFGGKDTSVLLFSPKTFDEAGELVSYLQQDMTCVMTLETVPAETARRLLDFLSGIAFALGGKITPVSAKTYFITPQNVDILGTQPQQSEQQQPENSGHYF